MKVKCIVFIHCASFVQEKIVQETLQVPDISS